MLATRVVLLEIFSGLCFAAAVAILAFTTLAPPLRIFAAGASAYAGLCLRHLDRRRLPRRCDTIGVLARLVTEQHIGRLARDRAPHTAPKIWRLIQQLAAGETGIDPVLSGTTKTYFRAK